jgi:hypothetical protein
MLPNGWMGRMSHTQKYHIIYVLCISNINQSAIRGRISSNNRHWEVPFMILCGGKLKKKCAKIPRDWRKYGYL